MKYILCLVFVLFSSSAFAQDKGWNVCINKDTKEIREYSYGDSGTQHCLDNGEFVVRGVPSSVIKDVNNHDELFWDDKDKNTYPDVSEIFKKKDSDIKKLRDAEEKKKEQRVVIDLSIKKDKAISLGYSDIANDYQKQIDEMQTKITSLTNE